MGTTIYSLLSVLWWNLVGQYMYYVYVKLSLTTFWIHRFLPRFNPGPPQWWLDTWHVYAWWNDNLDNRVPNVHFVSFYRRAAKDRFRDWINDAADTIARVLVDAVSGLLGSLLHGYTTFSTWIESIRNIVGTWTPWWASTLAAGLTLLYDWLPLDIVSGAVSFYDKFVAWYTATLSAAATLYDTARTWVANIAPGLVNRFEIIRSWFDSVGTWVTNFKADPYGTVVGLLGTAWTAWTGIKDDIVDFYNNVWVPYKITLHDFLADPLGWTYDRVEDELIRRW